MKRAISPATRGLGLAARHNRLFGEATFLALAAGSGASPGGCLEPRGFAPVAGRVPTAGWGRAHPHIWEV